MRLIIFDFEVFKYNTLLGSIIIDENKSELYQTWDLEEIKNFYENNTESIWIGHNILEYDNLIMEAVVKGKDTYKESKNIINSSIRKRTTLQMYSFDLMKQDKVMPYSLKVTEAYEGKYISETEVDFDLNRPLTEEEKLKTESYNRDDLNQTLDNFNEMISKFKMRLDILNEFNLPLKYLSISGTKLAAIVLGANQIKGIEDMKIKPKLYDSLQLKNEALKEYYLNEDFRTDKKINILVGGVYQQIGQGGIHSAIEKYHTDKALYFDVSGYYNLIMINYDLLPRTLPEESREKYIYMYHEQLRLKKIDPVKRGVYKTILLSVFGAMMNEYTDFYDPQKGLLVTITGQLFIVDLMEKLEGIAKVVQSNTDGIIVEPYDWKDESKVIEIVEEWEKRTGFVIKKEHIYDIWQRDVNCYCYKQEDGKIHVVGEAVRAYEEWEHMFNGNYFDAKEPIIYAYTTINYLMNKILPEQTIESNKNKLRMFQYLCKKKSFDWVETETYDYDTGETTVEKQQGINRCFPSSDENKLCTIYKCRKEGKVKRAKIANVPENIFIYNDELASAKIEDKIDWQYYIDRAYEKIQEFIVIPKIKEIIDG